MKALLVSSACLALIIVLATEGLARQADAWSVTGSLATERLEGHTSTLLKNGKVLLVGGFTVKNPCCVATTNAELYDPETGQWNATGSLKTPRSRHIAVRLADGKVLVAGGNTTGSYTFLNSAEIYDPDTGLWSSTGSLNGGRAGHQAMVLADGKVLIAGGEVFQSGRWFNYKTAELYDPTTGGWSSAGTMNHAHNQFAAVLLANGKVLVISGWSDVSSDMWLQRSTELYDPITRSWTLTGDLMIARAYPTATLLPNGKVLLVGGGDDYIGGLDTAELYDAATGQWKFTGRLNAGRTWHTATALPNGKVVVAGGYVDSGAILNSAELYDPDSETWSLAGSLNSAHSWHTATLLENGKVLIAGGRSSSTAAELYGEASPALTLNSTTYCSGASWNLTVRTTRPNTWIRLVGTSNGKPWEASSWRKTDAEGNVSETGTFSADMEGTHSLFVDIGGSISNTVSFQVSRCQIQFTLNSNDYCTGDSWNLRVESDFPNAWMNLSGSANNEPWEIPNWRRTGTDGTFVETGTFVPGSEGSHTMRVRVGAAQSNLFPFRVSRCGP
jgi:N-acetylneuraminic acid mutarotase